MIDRLEVVAEPREAWQLHLTFGETTRSGVTVAQVTDAVVRSGEFTLGPISVTIGAG